MTLTIQTATGQATIHNAYSKDGYKALWKYIKCLQSERVPFMVIPKGATVHDLHEVTSIDAIDV